MASTTPSLHSTARRRKIPAYKSFRISRRIKADKVKKLPSSYAIWKDTWNFLWLHKIKMLTFVALYAMAYLVLVKGISGFSMDIDIVKEELQSLLSGNIGAFITFITIYGSLLSSVTATQDDIGNYLQISIIVIFSLAFIWMLRRLHANQKDFSVKEAFYVGMGPLVPFLGVLLLLSLMLVPAGMGSLLLVTAQNSPIVGSELELMVFSIVMILTLVLTIYLLAGSIFSIYIVTIPKTGPIVAVRSSMKLLRLHRWKVLLKILWFYIMLVIAGFIIIVPFILWLPRYAEIAFFVLSSASFGVMHTYLYKLYRSML